MAQRGANGAVGDTLARQLGLMGRRPVVVAGIVLIAVTTALGLVLCSGSPQGFELARAEPSSEQEPPGEQTPEPEIDEGHESQERAATIVVDVDGAVNTPGVCRLSGKDARVIDAVTAAGGLSEEADTSLVNLAQTLEDGMKVYIPHKGEAAPENGTSHAAESVTASSLASPGDGKLNVNAASFDELLTLPGIGEAMAQAIIDERDSGGPFSSVDDLLRVSGIGEKRLQKIRDHVCV